MQSVEGVSEVASVGGFVKQYQIDVHPDKLRAHRVTLPEVYEAVRRSNIDVGAKVVENNGYEFFIRGIGFVKNVQDVEDIVIRQEKGTPIFVKNVATVQLGPDFRRGLLDKGGREAVGGVVVMRYGENPLRVIERLKEKIAEIEPGLRATLADGRRVAVQIVPFYDRTDIVRETVDTLREALIEEAIVGGIIVVIFLLHLRSALTILPTLPLSVAMSFIVMYYLGVDSNVMSLAGIAIAIGDVADMGIIMTENIYRRVAAERDRPYGTVVYEAATEVGPAIVTAVSNTIVSFIPVFALTDQEGKLFKPLAYTKTFAISASVILALTLVPVLCYYLLKPTQWSRRRSLTLAMIAGLAATLITQTVMAWQLVGSRQRKQLADGDRCRRHDWRCGLPHGARAALAAGRKRGRAGDQRSLPSLSTVGLGAQDRVSRRFPSRLLCRASRSGRASAESPIPSARTEHGRSAPGINSALEIPGRAISGDRPRIHATIG